MGNAIFPLVSRDECLRAGTAVLHSPMHPDLVADKEKRNTDHRREPRQQRHRIRPQDHQTRIVRNEGNGHQECENKAENRAEDRDRIFRIVLELEHQIEHIERILDPEAGRCCRILQGDHDKRCGEQEHEHFQKHQRREGKSELYPRIDERPDAKGKLSESLDVEYLGLVVEKQVDRAEAVFDEITRIDILPETPVVVKEALHRREGNERKAVQKQHLIVPPSAHRREIPEQDPEPDEARNIRQDHADRRDDEIRTVAHFAFEILR